MFFKHRALDQESIEASIMSLWKTHQYYIQLKGNVDQDESHDFSMHWDLHHRHYFSFALLWG